MRKTYRSKNVKAYWENRWKDVPIDMPMANKDAYPLKYSELIIKSKKGRILEAGCGAGRILRFYHESGYDIVGIDFINEAVENLKQFDETLNVQAGDITNLNFDDNYFKYILAFGLYHNLENELDEAVRETHRVLEKQGLLCASFRADNIQTKITDWIEDKKNQDHASDKKEFHKLNLTSNEFKKLFTSNGFSIEGLYPVENMPFFYKFRFFRSKNHKNFNELNARKEGYKLSIIGTFLQRILIFLLPYSFCNVYVLIARKI